MWELTINGVDLYHIINWFFIYSFLGWVWETFYVSIKHGEFINRGFISGPFCTIYGFGAISVYLILKPIENNLLFLFLGGIVGHFPGIYYCGSYGKYFSYILVGLQ